MTKGLRRGSPSPPTVDHRPGVALLDGHLRIGAHSPDLRNQCSVCTATVGVCPRPTEVASDPDVEFCKDAFYPRFLRATEVAV